MREHQIGLSAIRVMSPKNWMPRKTVIKDEHHSFYESNRCGKLRGFWKA